MNLKLKIELKAGLHGVNCRSELHAAEIDAAARQYVHWLEVHGAKKSAVRHHGFATSLLILPDTINKIMIF